MRRKQLALVSLLTLLGMLTQACAVPIRYAVPSEELYGREILGAQVRFQEEPDEPLAILSVEGDKLQKISVDEPKANARLQAALPGQRGEELVLETEDTRIWPSIVGALILGQIGMFVGEGVALANTQNNIGDNLLLWMSLGTVTGAVLGALAGAALADRIKPRHLVPMPPPKKSPLLVAPAVPLPLASTPAAAPSVAPVSP